MARPLALTLGEPGGIGPDITLAVWRQRAELSLPAFYLLADPVLMRRRAERLAPDVPIAVVDIGITVTAEPGRPDASSAPAALAAIRRAVRDVGSGAASAVVTNPI